MNQMRYAFVFLVSYSYAITTDQEAYHYCITHPDTFIGIVWPITPGNDETIKKILQKHGSIHYQKNIYLTYDQAFTLLQKAHPHIPDMKAHVQWYFPAGAFKKPARIFVLTFASADIAVMCKHAIRHRFRNLQYRSIHINDTHAETVELAEFFFR